MGRRTSTAEPLEAPVERLRRGALARGQRAGHFDFAGGSVRPMLRNRGRRALAATRIARTPTASRFSSAATNSLPIASLPWTADHGRHG
jgi:hypothetical protein